MIGAMDVARRRAEPSGCTQSASASLPPTSAANVDDRAAKVGRCAGSSSQHRSKTWYTSLGHFAGRGWRPPLRTILITSGFETPRYGASPSWKTSIANIPKLQT